MTGLYRDAMNQLNLNMGLRLPTDSIDEASTGFTIIPTSISTKRAVYTLQLDLATYDALPGITYSGTLNRLSQASSYHADIPLDYNVNGYQWG